MSTRAMVGHVLPDGRWRAVWNHSRGHTQHLGRWIIRQIKKAKGDLSTFSETYIEGCEEGWSSMQEGKRCDEPIGFLHGTFDGIVATCDAAQNPLCFDSHYLYLIHPPKRRLIVFEVADKVMRPFGMVTFDDDGKAKPTKLPPVE